MTSANISERPMICDDREALGSLFNITAPEPVEKKYFSSLFLFIHYDSFGVQYLFYYLFKNSSEVAEAHYLPIVLNPEIKVFDYLTPLFYWGETLDDNDLAQKDIQKDIYIDMLTGEEKDLKKIDLHRESDNKYRVNIDTSKAEQVIIDIEYNPDKDSLRLVAENNGELEGEAF